MARPASNETFIYNKGVYMLKTILVAIDSSDQRHAVLVQAAEIANRFEADLHAVLVRDLSQHWELNAAVDPEIVTALETEVDTLIEEARKQLEEAGITCQIHLQDGDAAEEISLLANRIGADLILIGHRHLSWLSRLVEKSVGSSLMTKARCNLMIIVEK